MRPSPIRIGCSGWQYSHWRGDLYPRELSQDRWFEFYAERFDTVELNNSFYRLPPADVFAGWARRAPAGFLLAVKASRYLTHIRRLREPREPLDRLWSRASRLGPHLGPMLYQLPPRWNRNVERLAAFADAVPPGRLQAVELRDASWYHPDTYAALARGDLALCLHDMAGSASPKAPVGPFVYVRFHGSGAKYGGRYTGQALRAWADRLVRWAGEGRACYAYFNNDVGGHAFRDAARLREMVARRV
ncbi:MAG TPA: DUF72 domain-containing protein [Candidatus Limnocylindria bacterium]|nr:DUF72 domain-containing protein [Candidatus Limnocylindria bacterium]